MDDEFDVSSSGPGPRGERRRPVRDGGLSVALVEERLVGGECSYWGCIPSKTLIRPGDVIAAARRVPGAAEAVTGEIDVDAALAQRDYMTTTGTTQPAPWLEDEGDRAGPGPRPPGRASGGRGRDRRRRDPAPRGARRRSCWPPAPAPFMPPIPGLADVRAWDNRAATAAKECPAGCSCSAAGPIGAEMAQAFRRLGLEEVTVVEGGPAAAGPGGAVRRRPGARGVRGRGHHGDHRAPRSRRRAGATTGRSRVTLDDGREIAGDELLVAVGRRPPPATSGWTPSASTRDAGRGRRPAARRPASTGGWLYAVGDCNGPRCSPTWASTRPGSSPT